MTEILVRADAREIPKCALRFENPKKRRLVALFRQLQQESETGTFFLSCRKAAEMVDTEYQKANLWMRLMVKNYKIIELVETGQLAGRKASEYRYTGD